MLDPLTGGLASRVYLAAFPKPRSAYEIAKMAAPGLPRNASGRILSLADQFPGFFEVSVERTARRKFKCVMLSKPDPFISRLSAECQLDHDEVELIESLAPCFREVVGGYLILALNRNPDYLKRSICAFRELLSVLCACINIAMCPRTVVSKVEGLMGGEIASFAEVAAGAASWETLTNLCRKVSSAAPLPLRIASGLIQFALL